MGYRFLEDIATADVAIEIGEPSIEELFATAAEALLATMVHDPDQVQRREELAFSLENEALDLLLFSFLGELIFYKDARRLLLHVDRVRIVEREQGMMLEALARGEKISEQHDLLVDVKAVTLHRLQVRQDEGQWRAVVVLDI